jgi:hypothetical protein
VKLADVSLWLNSPVLMQFDVLDRITALGPVKYLVALTRMHVWRLEEWHQLFPDAELWGPPQIPNKFQGLPFAGILGEVPPNGWADDLDQPVFEGNLFIDEVFFIHKKSRTVILADFIQNRPITKGEPFSTLFTNLLALHIQAALRSILGCLSLIESSHGDRLKSCFRGTSTS